MRLGLTLEIVLKSFFHLNWQHGTVGTWLSNDVNTNLKKWTKECRRMKGFKVKPKNLIYFETFNCYEI